MRCPTPTPGSVARVLAPLRERLAPSLGTATLAIACLISIPGCGPDASQAPASSHARVAAQRIDVPEPMITRDLSAIRHDGTLRVLLENSSSSYYFLRGGEYGFEYEVARDVARALDLRMQIVLPDTVRNPIDDLNLGNVDLVAMPHRTAALPQAELATTRAYDSAQPVIVTRQELSGELRTPDDLTGHMVAARRAAVGEDHLFDLRRNGVGVGIVMYPAETTIEELLDLVADGTYAATIATDRELASVMRFRPNLVEAFPIGSRHSLHWLVRSNAPALQAAIDSVLEHHYRARDDGSHAGSTFYNVVHQRYFADDDVVVGHASAPFRPSRTGRVSPYDDLFRAKADSFDLDWRLLASMAFQESRFDPSAVSWAGAVGIMQVKPTTAGLPQQELHDPPTNIAVGARHLRWLLDRYDYLPDEERLRFALAAYNCGHGHLDDARMLSMKRALDPNRWEGSVRESLLLLRMPKYHREARFGYVRGNETVGYVREILHRYDMLVRLTDRAERARGVRATPAVSMNSTR
mgnify:CR=1 FL=1